MDVDVIREIALDGCSARMYVSSRRKRKITRKSGRCTRPRRMLARAADGESGGRQRYEALNGRARKCTAELGAVRHPSEAWPRGDRSRETGEDYSGLRRVWARQRGRR